MLVEPTNYILLEDALIEPVSLEEVKEYLRIDGNDFDNILLPLITSARQLAEKVTGRDCINKKWITYLEDFNVDDIKILRSRLQEVESIKYYSDSSLITVNPSNYYFITDNDYSTIILKKDKSWEEESKELDDRRQPIEITFKSGYGDLREAVPQLYKQAILAQIAFMFNNAGDCSETSGEFSRLITPFIIPDLIFITN